MPLYPHLEDAAKFDAESLNTRFALLVDAINALGGASFQERALNTVHVPSPLPPSIVDALSNITTENNVAHVDTPSAPGSPPFVSIGIGGLGWTDYQTFTWDGYYLSIRGIGYTLDRTTGGESQPTAVLLLANVEVREFMDIEVIQTDAEDDARSYGISLNEYTWSAAIALEITDSAGTSNVLERTERQVSPRVTIGNFGNTDPEDPPLGGIVGRIAMGPLRDLPGGWPPVYEQFDYKTLQDVAIRTVITAADLTELGLLNIASVKLAFKSFNDRTYKVQRANITAIPLLAEVNT
jgi:hypothetical protein